MGKKYLLAEVVDSDINLATATVLDPSSEYPRRLDGNVIGRAIGDKRYEVPFERHDGNSNVRVSLENNPRMISYPDMRRFHLMPLADSAIENLRREAAQKAKDDAYLYEAKA